MNELDRLAILKKKHAALHSRIECLEAEKAPNEIIQRLKKDKLAVKDKIRSMEMELLKGWDG